METRAQPDIRDPSPATLRWQQVKSILAQALDLPPGEREQFVAAQTSEDASLQQEIRELLTFTDRADSLLTDDSELSAPSPGSELPECIGPYRVIREIGRGGMGVVCLAKRDDNTYDRVVALKLIGNSVHREKFAKLFWRERQILARLDHPNIARLLDGGTTKAGQPYYAMEYVEGEPLDKFARGHRLTLREKLEILLAVCSAVSYAHRNLIIHRDLKPTNILVTSDGVPKLLDFGVARILVEQDALHKTTTIPLTPYYASPEQIKGEPLTVATDIYSLGVLLYEILSARYPYGERENAAAAFRAILEDDPIPLREQSDGIPSDLANVVMKAIRKEPERRYPTVDALAQDIRDFLDGFPVRAMPDTFLYRFGKFTRRNRWTVLAASVAIVATIVLGLVIWREKQQAEFRFQQVRRLAHSVVFELDDQIQDLPGSSRARELLVARGLEYLNALARNRGRDKALLLELAQAYIKIGAAQGDLEQANVGNPQGAISSYNKAREILLNLRARDSSDRDVERSLALVDNDIAVLTPRARAALDLRGESITLFKDLAVRSIGPAGLKDRALAHFYLAFADTELNKFNQALPVWNQALAEYTALERQADDSFEAKRNVALVEKRLASVYDALGNNTAAITHERRATDIDESRLAAKPRSPTVRMDLSFDLVELGKSLHEVKKDAEATDALNRAIALRREAAGADPHDYRAQSELEVVLRLAGTLRSQSAGSEALALEQEAVSVGSALHARDPHNVQQILNLALDYFELGDLNRRGALENRGAALQSWNAALASFRRSEYLAAAIPASSYDDPNDREKLAQLPAKIAECLNHTSDFRPTPTRSNTRTAALI